MANNNRNWCPACGHEEDLSEAGGGSSWFATCNRDMEGRCLPKGGGPAPPKSIKQTTSWVAPVMTGGSVGGEIGRHAAAGLAKAGRSSVLGQALKFAPAPYRFAGGLAGAMIGSIAARTAVERSHYNKDRRAEKDQQQLARRTQRAKRVRQARRGA